MGPLLMMEDHRDAFFFWQKLGIKHASCLHIDAHLDMAGFLSPLESSLQFPEINCANYLLKAVEQDLVTEVVWVIPPHLSRANQDLLHWAYQELPRWLSLDLNEVNSLQLRDGRVIGQLREKPFTICTSEQIPQKNGPWLLDLDLDYLIDNLDQVWQTPFQLYQLTQHLDLQAITIAYSIHGGYTPMARRYLGRLSQLLWSGLITEAEQWWQQFNSLKNLEHAPAELRASVLVARAWGSGSDHQGKAWDEAASLDSGFKVQPYDVAALYWQRKQYQHCLHWLEQMPPEQTAYLRGFIALEQHKPLQAIQYWQSLLVWTEKEVLTQRHLYLLLAKAHTLARQPLLALESLGKAIALPHKEGLSELYREQGRIQRQQKLNQEATSSLRKAIRLAPDKIDNIEAQIDLAELYIETQQALRAQAEYRKLSRLQLPGNLRVRAERLLIKIALSQRHIP